ncbi:glycosyl hydrolase family 18 protein [Pseudomonas entomophila]|uniref:glycosyl hydrolase family 18 protein n=1 Tax=Pseudomonas entomophila TaxID=312306 RepID=UPI00240695F8|nr:glycosyl hydrolase family 18 protein [Pseudomonas entomophila]MDF9616406.1 glycosyl hydrolase family 18 protein [Pseudomonas entomophila]
MQAQSNEGLQLLFEKNKGVDSLYLYNASKSPIKLRKLVIRTNVFVGKGIPANLTDQTIEWLKNDGQPYDNIENRQKVAFLRSKVQVDWDPLQLIGPNDTVKSLYEDFFCPWGSLFNAPKRAPLVREEFDDHYLLTLGYAEPVVIGPYEQVELFYANSFYGLPMRSPIVGVQCLPKVSVLLDANTSGQGGAGLARAMTTPQCLQEVPLEAVILQKEGGERRVLDRSMAGKAKSADLTRRFVGYYANYFMYKRNYFVTDIPVDHVNCISYGMMNLQGDGTLCSSDEWSDNFQVAALQFMKQLNPNLQVSLIVGGWPKSPKVTFTTVDDLALFPACHALPTPAFGIYIAQQNNESAWKLVYLPEDADSPAKSLDLLRPPSLYRYARQDPGGLFDDEAGKRELWAWLVKHGSLCQGRCIDAAEGEATALDLELMRLLSNAFDAQQDIAPFSNQFRQISRDPAQRQRLAQSAARALDALAFDGFEVDWEYPKSEDGDGYVSLLDDLRNALGTRKLAIAAPSSPEKVKFLTEAQWRGIGDRVDYVNVMSYDYHGAWSDKSWFNAPMGTPGAGAEPAIDPTFSITATIDCFLGLVEKNCLTRRQLALGLAAYGRPVTVKGATDDNKGLRCLVNKDVQPDEVLLYRYIVEIREAGGYRPAEGTSPSVGWPGLTFVSELEAIARAPYAYAINGDRSISLTYDDPRSLREKVRHALKAQLGGVMLWDLSGDLHADHKDSLIAAVSDELRQCHPATTQPLEAREQDLWLVAAQAGEPVATAHLASQVREYGAVPGSHIQALGDQAVQALAALPGGGIAVASASAVRLLTSQRQDFETQRSLALAETQEPWSELLLLDDGSLLLQRGNGALLSLQLQGGRCQVQAQLADDTTKVVRFGPDKVAALQGQALKVWCNGRAGLQPIAHLNSPVQLAVLAPLASGQLLLVSLDGEVLLWEASTTALRVLPRATAVPVPRLLRLLPDGRLLACQEDGTLQLWQVVRENGRIQGLSITPQPWNGGARRWLDIVALPNGGFASLSRERLVLWQGAHSPHPYEVIQQISVQDARALAVLDNGNLLVAQGGQLRRLDFPGWPQVQGARFTPWQATDKEGRTALHWLARRAVGENLEQLLASGAPADPVIPGNGPSLLAEAMAAGQAGTAALLLRAGAPLWQAGQASAHGQLLTDELLAQLMPEALLATLPTQVRIARLKADFRLAQLPAQHLGLLMDYPVLTGRLAICLYLLMPPLTRQLQNLLSHFVIDDDCLAELRLQCPGVVADLAPLYRQAFEDDVALRASLSQQLAAATSQTLDAIENAARRVNPEQAGQGRYGEAIYQQGIAVLQWLLEHALEQPLLAIQHKQLMEQFAALAAPQAGDLLSFEVPLGASDLPSATLDFLTLYPRAGASMASQLERWSPALAKRVSEACGGITDTPQESFDLPGDAYDSAHQAMRQLLVATVRPPISAPQAAAFLEQHATSPWSPTPDPLGQPLGWVNWAFDPPPSRTANPVPVQAPQAPGSDTHWQAPGQGGGTQVPAQPSHEPDAPDFDDHSSYIARVRAAGEEMAEKSSPGKDYFSDYFERTRAKAESAHPLSKKIDIAKLEIDGSNKQINIQSHDLDELDLLPSTGRKYEYVAKKSGTRPDPNATRADQEQAVTRWVNGQKAEIGRMKSSVDKRRKDVERMQEQRTTEVNADKEVARLANRKASLEKLNSGLDNTREVLQGLQGISKFTRTLVNKFAGDWSGSEDFNTVLDYVDLTISITIATIDTIKSISNALSSGGAMGLFGAAMSVVSLASSIYSMFNPQPDPYLEAAKAISQQITQVYEALNKRFDQVMEQLQNMNQSLTWQISVFNHQVDARFDGLQRQLDDMSMELTQHLDRLNEALISGMRMTRNEIRGSTQQVLASIVWSHDDLANRIELANQGFRADLDGLNALMNTQLLAELNEIDVVVRNAERERGNTPALIALSEDPQRLQQMRDRLESGMRHKLLAGGIERPLANLCFDSFESAEVMNRARVMATDHFAECFAYYHAAQTTDSIDRSSKVWLSTAVAFPLVRRYLHVQTLYAGKLENPLSILDSVVELVDAPLAKSRHFLVSLQQDKGFFARLLDQVLDSAQALQHASRGIVVRDAGQNLRLPTAQLSNTPFLLTLMFDRFARLALTDLALETIESDRQQWRERDLAAVQAFLNAPAGGWRQQKVCRALALGHALNACDLSLVGDDTTRQLVMQYGGAPVPLVEMKFQDDRVIEATLLLRENGLFVALGQDCHALQQQWIAAYNGRIALDCAGELKRLDGCLSRLALFLALAGASAQQLEQVLGLCWSSQRVVAYLQAQAGLSADTKAQLSPPFALLASYTGALSKQAEAAVDATLNALVATASQPDELPSLRHSLLAQLSGLEQQSRTLRSGLGGDDLSDLLRAQGARDEEGVLRLPFERLSTGMSFEAPLGIEMRVGCTLTLAGSGQFSLTSTSVAGHTLSQRIDLDSDVAVRVSLAVEGEDDYLASLGFSDAQGGQDVWLEGVWIKPAQ